MDASVAAIDAKILRIFCENPFLVKIFAIWPPAALRGPSRGGNVARCIAEGVTTPLVKEPLPMVAITVAIIDIHFSPFLSKSTITEATVSRRSDRFPFSPISRPVLFT